MLRTREAYLASGLRSVIHEVSVADRDEGCLEERGVSATVRVQEVMNGPCSVYQPFARTGRTQSYRRRERGDFVSGSQTSRSRYVERFQPVPHLGGAQGIEFVQYELAIAVKVAGCLGSPSEGDASNAPACEAPPVIACWIGDVFKRTAINSGLFRVQSLE